MDQRIVLQCLDLKSRTDEVKTRGSIKEFDFKYRFGACASLRAVFKFNDNITKRVSVAIFFCMQ